MPDDAWSAQLRSGPFDGAEVGLGIPRDGLPEAVIVTFVDPGPDGRPVAHSYVLDEDRAGFRYLGPDPSLGEPDPDAPVLDVPLQALALIGSGDHDLAHRFYELLLDRHPDVRPMFADDIRPQVARFSAALRSIVENGQDPAWVETSLAGLGRLHGWLGVTEPMYDMFSDCMLDALRERSGDGWTPRVRASWVAALETMRAMMLAGAREDD